MSQIGTISEQRTAAKAQVLAGINQFEMGASRLPEIAKPRTLRAVVALNHVWVLHKILIVRVGAALFMALILAVGFQARGGISQAVVNTGDLLASRIAVIGFGIGEISISGQSMAMETDIVAAVAIDSTSNIFNFDVEAARVRILEIPSISDVSVRKIYPSSLIVAVSEVTPIARWRVDGVTFVIDGKGIQIASATSADENLPLVIGDGAADDAFNMIIALENYPVLKEGLLALSRIADRRWDMIYSSGLRIQLPETEVGRALFQLREAQNNSQLLDRDLSIIDMRVATIAALRVNKREEPSH